MILVGNSKLFAAMSAARSQHAAAILCCHSLTETVLVHSPAVVRLKCSFHLSICVIIVTYPLLGVPS